MSRKALNEPAAGRFKKERKCLMFGLDKALKLPGEIAKQSARAAAQLPAVPFDVADKAREGMEEGIEKLTEPQPRKRFEDRTGD